MRFLRFTLWLAIGASVMLAATVRAAGDEAATPDKPKILIISSFHFSHQWSQSVIAAVRDTIVTRTSGNVIDLLELNAVRNSRETIAQKAEPYLRAIAAGDYKLVVAILDDAADLLWRGMDRIPPQTMLVLYTQSDRIAKIRARHPETTGVQGSLPVRDTVALGLRLLPKARDVLIITDPEGVGPELAEAAARMEWPENISVKIINGGAYKLPELLTQIRRMPETALVIWGFYRDYMRDGYPSLPALTDAVTAGANRALMVMTDMLINHNVLGGVVSKGDINGRLLGEIVLDAMTRGSVVALPPRPEQNRAVVDMTVAARCGVDRAKVPREAVKIHEIPSKWKRYQTFIWAGFGMSVTIIVLSILVGILLSRNRRLRRQTAYILQLRDQAEQMEAQSRERNHFLARMNREIRTPLNAVIGFSELLQNEPHLEFEERREYLAAINNSGKSLLKLIGDFLDVAQLEAGILRLNPRECDLTAVLKSLVAEISERAKAKNIAVVFRCPVLPVFIADEARMRQLLWNLMDNAVRFTIQGRIEIEVQSTPRDSDCGKLTVRIVDTGIGVEPREQRKIFEPFIAKSFPGHDGSAIVPGPGLGLPLVKLLVQLMGGLMKFKSQPGQGTDITLTFPNIQYRR